MTDLQHIYLTELTLREMYAFHKSSFSVYVVSSISSILFFAKLISVQQNSREKFGSVRR